MFKTIPHIVEYEFEGKLVTQKTEQTYLFGFKWGKNKVIYTNRDPIIYDQIIPTDKFGHPFVLKVGSKIISKSDGDEPYWIGEVFGFDNSDGKYSGTRRSPALPIIKDEDGNVYMTFAICLPYNEELITILKALDPVEQWNFLCRDHCQRSELNGKSYLEYPLDSKSAIMQWYKNNAKKMYRV
jgi:hypothetical protein